MCQKQYMIINIQGEKYFFDIVSRNNRQLVSFYIRATCKLTKRTSCINNLNTILSEFNIDSAKRRFADSTWEVSRKEAGHFINTAKGIFSSIFFLNLLENKLDEDRTAGEWENELKSH